MPRLNPDQWQQVEAAMSSSRLRKHGLPARRSRSVVIGTFNIRMLGSGDDRTGSKRSGRTPGAWRFLARICYPFDLLAIQEVLDELAGLRRLQEEIRRESRHPVSLLISDIAGARPGKAGDPERLAFLYYPRRIEQTELASEVTTDRSAVAMTLEDRCESYTRSLHDYAAARRLWSDAGEPGGRRPRISFPSFLTFIRPPHLGSFRIRSRAGAHPIDLIAVNAHLLYGDSTDERLWEFLELIEWLALRAKYADRLYAPNLLLLGDCNLETRNMQQTIDRERTAAGHPPDAALITPRDFLNWKLKSLNKSVLTSRASAEANFPLLDIHPSQGSLRTNARQGETYDQIGLFHRDPRLPGYELNETVNFGGDTYDYGVFRFTDLLAEVLEPEAWEQAERDEADRRAAGEPPESPFCAMERRARDRIIDACEYDISDHLPAWIRLPIPGAG